MVKFISRYKDSTVYSVDGERVTVKDNGFVSPYTTDAQKEKLWFHWLDTYADFLVWLTKKEIPLSEDPLFSFTPKFYLT